jgi:hypothetical protein
MLKSRGYPLTLEASYKKVIAKELRSALLNNDQKGVIAVHRSASLTILTVCLISINQNNNSEDNPDSQRETGFSDSGVIT